MIHRRWKRPVTHSHMPLRHLLRQLQTGKHSTGDSRPEWLVELIESVAGLFEPMLGVARVGYDCWPTENDWTVCLYLGDTEIVGGKEDGRQDPPEFSFDLLGLLERIDEVQRLRWSVFPVTADEGQELGDRSFITVIGRVADNQVRIRLLSIAPDAAGPALRLFPNGDCETI